MTVTLSHALLGVLLLQAVQAVVCPGVHSACLGSALLLRARARHQEKDHHGAEGDVQSVHQGAQRQPGHQPAQVISPVVHHDQSLNQRLH